MALTGRTGLLALVGALLVGAILPSWWGIAFVEGALAIGILADLVLAGSVRNLRFNRSGDARVRLGDKAEVVLTVENPGPRRLKGLLRDAWSPSAGAIETRFTLDVPAGERRRLTVTLQPTRRGDRRAHRVTVRAIGPLRLAARQGSHRVPWSVRVLPPFTSRRHLPAKLARLRELDGRTSVMVRGQGTEFDSLRDYVDGDDVRSIDWRATARRNDIVVRTWRPERDRHILVVLDTGRTSAGRVGDIPRLDAAMDAALLLTALAWHAGDRVDLLAYDRQARARVKGIAAANPLPAFVEAMARLEPELVEMDAGGLAASVLQQAGHRSLIVLITGLESAAIEDGLLPILPKLASRHELLIAAVSDPRIEEMAAQRGNLANIYDAASAERTKADRQRITAALERHGVSVVDATPAELPSRLADLYIALKHAGRL